MISSYLALFFALCLGNNIIVTQLLGINPVLAANSAAKTTQHYTVETAAILLLASLLNYAVYHLLLAPLALTELALLCFMLIIASCVQALDIVAKRLYPEKARYLGKFLPLIMANCAILGLSLQLIAKPTSLPAMLISTVAVTVGFVLIMQMFIRLQARLAVEHIPKPFRGVAIHLVTLSLLSLAWMGFTGI